MKRKSFSIRDLVERPQKTAYGALQVLMPILSSLGLKLKKLNHVIVPIPHCQVKLEGGTALSKNPTHHCNNDSNNLFIYSALFNMLGDQKRITTINNLKTINTNIYIIFIFYI